MKKQYLGRIFVSHSSKDKPFVRQLARRLWEDNYEIWLDEKELVPGDRIAARLSDAIKECPVILVVVTPNSASSKWVKYELAQASERMVKEDCRIIPVLKGNVELLPELRGLVFADFRSSFSKGISAIFAALKEEENRAEAKMKSRGRTEEIIREVFDSTGWGGTTSDHEFIHYNFVEISALKKNSDDAHVLLDIIHDHWKSWQRQPDELSDHWWREYSEATEILPHRFRLIVSERRISFALDRICPLNRRVGACLLGPKPNPQTIVVAIDISGLTNRRGKLKTVKLGKKYLVQLSNEVFGTAR